MAEQMIEDDLVPQLDRHPDVEAILTFLAALRQEAGRSQWDVAIEMGSSQSHISMLETGAARHPQSTGLAKLARSLGCQLTVTIAPDAPPERIAQAIVVARRLEAETGIVMAVSRA